MRVVVLDDYQRCAHEFADWAGLGADVEFVDRHLSRPELVEKLAGAEVVVAMRERSVFDAALLDRLDDLRLLVTTGMRNASIDVSAARRRGVTVCGTRGLDSPAAEMTWALILALVRHVPREDAALRAGGWQATVGADLAGHTLGIVGLGRLGSRVARVGLAFDMDVVAWSQNLDPEHARAQGVEATTKDQLLERSDVVSLHLKLGERSRGVIGADDLRRMKRSAFLVNTARGPLVDEPALLAALDEGRIAGAALDVFDDEPLPADHPLRRSPRTVLAPHLGYVTRGSYAVFYADAVEDIRAWRDGDPIRLLEA